MSQPPIPRWSLQFFEANHQYAAARILVDLRRLNKIQQHAIAGHAVRLLKTRSLARQEKLRNGAVRLIVALLPSSFNVFEKLLSDFRSPFWYEVHFLAFNAVDREDLSARDQRRVLALVENYLMTVDKGSGFAAWKAGDMLGDEWNSPETVEILARVMFSARYVAGRKGALHGMAHAMDTSEPREEKRLLLLVRKVAAEDRSKEVRRYASFTIQGNGCYRGEGKGKKTP
jgi:hypothetical protein